MSNFNKKQTRQEQHKHHKQHIKTLEASPCNRPPHTPTGVDILYFAREAKTHLEFDGKIVWDKVATDTSDLPINTVDEYEVQYRATDSQGVPVETDPTDGYQRMRVVRKVAVQHAQITAATETAGVFTYTTSKDHGFSVGDRVKLSHCTPSAYNGNKTITVVSTPTTFKTLGVASTADMTGKGLLEDNIDSLHIITMQLPKPKNWWWVARVRARSGKGCWSTWSPWTYPSLPFANANPMPPAPTGLALSYDRVGKHRNDLFRGRVEWTEVTNFDYPGTPADDEQDLAGYAVKVEISETSINGPWNAYGQHFHRDASPEDGNTTAHITFHKVHRKYFYRAAVRSVDRFHRRGPWSGWVASQGGDATLPTPPTILADISAVRRVGLRWAIPMDGNLPDPTVAHVHFQISKNNSFSSLVDEGFKAPGTGSHRYAIPKSDEALHHYMRIRSIDSEGNQSAWVPNASPGELLDGELDSTTGVPIGSIFKFHPKPANLPSSGVLWKGGYLWCDGAPVPKLTYAALYAEIGDSAGVAADPSMFLLPDHRGRHGLGITTSGTSLTAGVVGSLSVGDTPDGATIEALGDVHGTHTLGKFHHNHNVPQKDTLQADTAGLKTVGSGSASTVAGGVHHHTMNGQYTDGPHDTTTTALNDNVTTTDEASTLSDSKGHPRHKKHHHPWIALVYAIRAI